MAQGIRGFIIIVAVSFALATQSLATASHRSTAPARETATTKSIRSARATCVPCEGRKQNAKRNSKLARQVPCHPKSFVDPKIAKSYQKAIHDLKRDGIKPQVTSAWRSSAEQARLHRCSQDRNCRARNPGLYYALPSGHSLHEAAFAVDISGVASGPKGRKQITPRGRRIISVMRKNGFKWRYGLKDPAHFEADPTRKGYRSVQQAIHKNQTTCAVKLAKVQKPAGRTQATALHKTASSKQIASRRRNSKA
ncbi:MAG: D-alanyl-D-alanine carboxypeptidase family protein [Blastocatellia bacterium]